MGALYAFDLDVFIKKFNCNTLIETGTGEGVGVLHGLKFPFKKIYSIEIMKELFEKTALKITDPRALFLNCDSLVGLKLILEKMTEKDTILFWLDAHFPGADFHLNGCTYDDDIPKELKLPLKMELDLIKRYRYGKDVVIIDDLNHYEDGDFEAGNLPERYRYLRNKYNLNGIDFIHDDFDETHSITKDFRHQGYIILTPKTTCGEECPQ